VVLPLVLIIDIAINYNLLYLVIISGPTMSAIKLIAINNGWRRPIATAAADTEDPAAVIVTPVPIRMKIKLTAHVGQAVNNPVEAPRSEHEIPLLLREL
jgi:hypothetical protein